MKPIPSLWALATLILNMSAWPQVAAAGALPSVRTVDIKASDSTELKASYYSAGKPGPGVLLLHQVNRDRHSWDGVARQLAAAGINVLALDTRGHGESGGAPFDKLSPEEQRKHWRGWADDADAGFLFLVSQPGVDGNVIGIGGAGLLGVDNGVAVASRHPTQMKSLVLMSGETFRDGLQFLHQSLRLPGLYVVSDLDEYPPTVEAMNLLYATASNPGRKLVRYPSPQEAPWLWYEPFDPDKLASTGNHGTDLFQTHPDLPTTIVNWFVTTLIKTPGQAPADPVATAPILVDLETPGGAARVTQQLIAARMANPGVQIFPEISASIVGFDYQRAGDNKSSLEVLKLVALAYPDSADALSNVADAYLEDGQKDLARQYAERALAILDAHTLPASSWSDTDEHRGEIRRGIERTLAQLNADHPGAAGSVFRECPDCPEMVVIPAGSFTMGSPDAEKAWAVSQGAVPGSVADEAPQHAVTLKPYALGKYDVTRSEYSAFVKDTGYAAGKGCYEPGNPDTAKLADASWQTPGFSQTGRDPVVCVSWWDAKAYVAWLNKELSGKSDGPYRLPSESEWEYAACGGTLTKFWWGDDASAATDHAWFKDNAGGVTHPVGLKPANPFGLEDVVGNVSQWTGDCYAEAESYAGAPTDGSAAQGKDDCLRSDRGGSWWHPAAWLMRSATRERTPADYRGRTMGFRLARNIP